MPTLITLKDLKIRPITLSEDDKSLNEFLDKRILELQAHRKNVCGVDIDSIMEQADEDIKIKDTIFDKRKGKTLVENNDTLGWRGTSSFKDLGVDNWRSDAASVDPFVKVMIAMSIIFDNDPHAVLRAGGKRYAALNEVYKQLYQDSWDVNFSREQLKCCVFDLTAYGWMIGRTSIRANTRIINEIVEINPETYATKEEEKEIEDFSSIQRKRLDPKRAWLDDMATANDQDSIGDWAWSIDYSYDKLQAEFGDTQNFDMIPMTGEPDPEVNKETKAGTRSDVYTVEFYENKCKDRFVARVGVGGQHVPLVYAPLPDHKELSCWTTFWNMRNPKTPYGVGPIEIMRSDKNLKNKIKNMTVDQIVLSIYKMFFYENKGPYKDRDRIQIKPGVGEEIKGKVTFLDIPGPGEDAKYGIEFAQNEIDNNTGITKPLMGEITGQTAFEVGQAKESALKRIKLPLDNLAYALQIEARLSLDLMYQAYTTPIVEKIVDADDIADLERAWTEDPSAFSVGTDKTEKIDRIEEGDAVEYWKTRYKEFELSTEKNEDGIFVPTGDRKFFYVMPDFTRWRGEIKIKAASLLSVWKELEKRQTLDLAEIMIQYLQLSPEIARKPLLKIVEKFDDDPKEWVPDAWLNPQASPAAKMGAEVFGKENLPGDMQKEFPEEPIRPTPRSEVANAEAPINKTFNA